MTTGDGWVLTLASLDGDRSGYVAPVVEQLRTDGFDCRLEPVPNEFQPGAMEMTVVDGG